MSKMGQPLLMTVRLLPKECPGLTPIQKSSIFT
jgi:hypothetical protein